MPPSPSLEGNRPASSSQQRTSVSGPSPAFGTRLDELAAANLMLTAGNARLRARLGSELDGRNVEEGHKEVGTYRAGSPLGEIIDYLGNVAATHTRKIQHAQSASI